MSRIAFLFPGQGAQAPGMGMEIARQYPAAMEVFDRASAALERDMAALCFYAEPEELTKTIHAQPAIMTMSLSIMAVLAQNKIVPDAVAGFSLGECSALAAANVISEDVAFRLIDKRSRAMQRASEEISGSMMAVMGMDADKLLAECGKIDGYIAPVNYNCPGQIVVTCESDVADRAEAHLKNAGASRIVRLAVGGAFHSKLMQKAADRFEQEIADFPFAQPAIPYYSNVDGKEHRSLDSLSRYLAVQMVSPVRWQDEVENMLANGIDVFVEVGPGKTLSGFVKKVKRDASVYQTGTLPQLEQTLSELKK
jgi:[acyl-carrier-protein] S-malonyltransferase